MNQAQSAEKRIEQMSVPHYLSGKLEKFKPKEGYALVRVGDILFHVPFVNRGKLNTEGKIDPCLNGERYEDIPPRAPIELKILYNHEGKNPLVVAWAPKVSKAAT